MPKYAIYEDNVILDIIIADSKEIAEEHTGKNAIEMLPPFEFPHIGWILIDGDWIPSADLDGWEGWTLSGDQWIPPSPFESWIWSEDLNSWIAPVPRPSEGLYYWDENTKTWILIPEIDEGQ